MVALVIFVTLINCGAIMEQRRWVFYLEFARGALIFITAYHYFPHPTLLFLIWAVLIGGILYFSTLQKQYLQTIYGR